MRAWIFFISVFFLVCIKQNAQTGTGPDACLWTTLNLEKKFSNNLAVLYTQEFRLRENLSQINLFYSDIGVEYGLIKNLKTSLSYRNIQKVLPEGWVSLRHRITWDLNYKKKFNHLSLHYRNRIQTEYRNIYTSVKGKLPEWFWRQKFTAKYELSKRLTPYAAIEFRYQITDPRNQKDDRAWHRVRYQAGCDYQLDKRKSIGAYYLIQNEFETSDPNELYVLGLELTISF